MAEHTRAGTRADVQALRAAAVLAVLTFHVWPGAIPGGYVGVDVFFVISGFLITGQLVRRQESGALALADFWTRRVRRLLPLSLTVLLASVAGALLFTPPQDHLLHLRSVIGSALYVENWFLAADAVDYLAADSTPPIAQHFWSLSVEEQFYVGWPLLLALAWFLGRRRRGALVLTVGVTTLAALVTGVLVTAANPAWAFFATPLRIWEFGVGGLIALGALRLPHAVPRPAVAVVGWVGIAVACLTYGPSTPFPGTAALLPVLAAGAVIAANVDSGPLDAVARWRPVEWLGDQSYGIYLWHWPLVIVAPGVLGHPPRLWQNVLLVALCLVLAATSKRFIEDPIRFGRARRPALVALVTGVAMAVVVTAAAVPSEISRRESREVVAKFRSEGIDAPCAGAKALLSPTCDDSATPVSRLIPDLAGVSEDTSGAFSCYAFKPESGVKTCTFGSTKPSATRIALTGDSHAAMMIPALRRIAQKRDWNLTTFVGRGCGWSTDVSDPTCGSYREQLSRDLDSGDFDTIVMLTRTMPDASKAEIRRTAEDVAAAWRPALDRGTRVVAIEDNPVVPSTVPECLARRSKVSQETCSFSEREAYPVPDQKLLAARIEPRVEVVRTRDWYCVDGRCPVVAGGVVLYRDEHHITASYSATLATTLGAAIERARKAARD